MTDHVVQPDGLRVWRFAEVGRYAKGRVRPGALAVSSAAIVGQYLAQHPQPLTHLFREALPVMVVDFIAPRRREVLLPGIIVLGNLTTLLPLNPQDYPAARWTNFLAGLRHALQLDPLTARWTLYGCETLCAELPSHACGAPATGFTYPTPGRQHRHCPLHAPRT